MIERMKNARPKKPNFEASEVMPRVWMKPQSVADMLGLPIEILVNWRQTDVGPSYIKLTPSARGRVRYQSDTVLEWQRSCMRVVPEGWRPIGTFPGEGAPSETGKVEWLPPGRAAVTIKIPIATLTAWRRRAVGLPFVWIGGGGQHQVMYDRRDLEAFISRRQVDPSVVPVIAKNVYRSDRFCKCQYRDQSKVVRRKSRYSQVIMAIFKRGAIYWFQFEFRGSRVRESSFSRNKEVCERLMRERRRTLELSGGGLKEVAKPRLFGPAAKAYLLLREPHWTQKTRLMHSNSLTHLMPHFGKIMLAEIDKHNISKYQRVRLKEEASPQYRDCARSPGPAGRQTLAKHRRRCEEARREFRCGS
jgi:hypothetical protein